MQLGWVYKAWLRCYSSISFDLQRNLVTAKPQKRHNVQIREWSHYFFCSNQKNRFYFIKYWIEELSFEKCWKDYYFSIVIPLIFYDFFRFFLFVALAFACLHVCFRLGCTSTQPSHFLYGQRLSIGYGIFSIGSSSLLFSTIVLCCTLLI